MRHSSDIWNINTGVNREKEISKKNKSIWINTFWPEFYNSDYNYWRIIKTIKDKVMHWYTPEKYWWVSKTKASKLIKEVEDRNCKLDIEFLESLDNEKKYLLSKLFINWMKEDYELDSFFRWKLESLWDPLSDGNLVNKFINKGTKDFLVFQEHAIFIWMIYWSRYNYNSWLINHKWFVDDLDSEFERFNHHYFMQAYCFLLINSKNKDLTDKYIFKLTPEDYKLKQPDKFFFDVLAEYNLLKNLDWDVNSINICEDLWEDFSLKVFHWRDDIWAWYELKYGFYWLDKEWNEIPEEKNLWITWFKKKVDELNVPYTSLDRDSLYDDKGNYIDASWKEYCVYIDSPSGISLFYKNEPVAIISFYIRNWNELFINQIQRISYKKYDKYWRYVGLDHLKILDKVDRENFLYGIVESLAPKYWISRIIIQWSKNNKWTKEHEIDGSTLYYQKYFESRDSYLDDGKEKRVHLSQDIAKKIYDNFALELWFALDNKWNYYKDVIS